jgi:benzylsuccinate CoA-transferase BbsF subunit
MTGKRALEGLKVADFSWFGAGPIAAEHLASFGATVIRIESESHIDALRTIAPMKPGNTGYNSSGYFNNFNAGKYDLLLNMNADGSQPIARKLVEWADVFLTNITPRVIERWGLTYDILSEWNPKIIAAYQPMQGYNGPHRDFLGFGAVLTPITGYSYLSGFPTARPIGVGTNYPDYVINPGHTLVAILAALHYRRRTGKGQLIECAQLESSVAPLGPAIFDYTANGHVFERCGNRIPEAAPHNAYACAPLTDGNRTMDQRWLAIACFSDDQWRTLADTIGSDLASDARFATLAARKENETDLDAAISAWTADKDAYQLMDQLQSRGVPAGVVQSARELLDVDEHIRERGFYKYLDHPETGRAAYDGPPFVLSKTPGELAWPAPLLGEHTEYVCKDILGLGDEDIANLMVAGVLQ